MNNLDYVTMSFVIGVTDHCKYCRPNTCSIHCILSSILFN